MSIIQHDVMYVMYVCADLRYLYVVVYVCMYVCMMMYVIHIYITQHHNRCKFSCQLNYCLFIYL
jgi:hypothetical protein